jgi:hypothetical protein
MARIEVRLDEELKLEAEAYARVKGYGRASNLARVALVNYMTRNALTGPQKVRYERILAICVKGPAR